MTFFDISKKMLKSEFHRYRLFFLCNFFAITLFFSFAAIFTNETFHNPAMVDPMISSNIFFPSVLVTVFILCFLPFSYSNFLSSRKRDYGILLILGMCKKDIRKNMILEGFAVSAIALTAALGFGTIVSFVFYWIISKCIGIAGLKWKFQPDPYVLSVLLYIGVMILTVLICSIRIFREKIRTLMEFQSRAEKKGWIYRMMRKFFPLYMKRHMLEWSFLIRHRREWGIRYIIATLIIVCVTSVFSMGIVIYQSAFQNVIYYAPYDMVYSQIWGRNEIDPDEIATVLSQHGVSVTEQAQVHYARDNAFNYIPVSEADQIFGCDYQISQGEFLNLFQYKLADGYEHDLTPVTQISLPSEDFETKTGRSEDLWDNRSKTIYSVGSDVKILFNQNPTMADRTLIVSDKDFERIQNSSEYWNGIMNLFRFENWKTSYDGVAAVQSVLQSVNGLDDTEQHYYAAASRIENYKKEEQAGRLFLFLIGFVAGLLLLAEWLLIYFRIFAEREEVSRSMNSLNRIGLTDAEQFYLIQFKNRMRFLPPVIAGMGLSVFPSYWLSNQIYHSGWYGCLLSIVFGACILVITMLSIRIDRGRAHVQ